MLSEIIVLAILLFLSGLFSSSETAITSIDKVKLKGVLSKYGANDPKVKYLKNLKTDIHYTLMTILLGNNLVNIGASAYVSIIAYKIGGNSSVALATGILTFLILIFGEILPKTFGLKQNVNLALNVAQIIYYLKLIFYPILVVLDWFLRIFVKERIFEDLSMSEEEFMEMIELFNENGQINETEREIMYNILELADTSVSEIFTPRTRIVAIEANATLEEAMKRFKESGFSRLPVYKEKLDNIVGIIYAKDILKVIDDEKRKKDKVIKYARKAVFIPENKKVDDLLKQFLSSKTHMAIVVDEFGGVSGLVTLEDVLEMIVGEIYDENEIKNEQIIKINEHTYIVDPFINIDDFAKRFNLKIPEGDYDSLSGFILEHVQRIPTKNERIEFDDFDIVILDADNKKIRKVKLILKHQTNESNNKKHKKDKKGRMFFK